MNRTATPITTKSIKKNVKQLNDKKNGLDDLKKEISNRADQDDCSINSLSLSTTVNDKFDEKLNNFLCKVKDDDARENCFKKLDDHINNLLDTVKLREKKRKSKF